jgi:hypothetical protein
MSIHTLPPTRHHSSIPISLPTASTLLETYISLSETHPHLHPDALITPTGVTFSAHGGPLGGAVMHNLRRVAAGLRGEYLEPAVEEDEEAENTENAAPETNEKGSGSSKKDVETTANEGWQPMSEYEREEGKVEVGEIGERDHFVASGVDLVPEVLQVGDGDEDAAGKKRKGENKLDKEARKKAKKERNKEFKRRKEGKKAAGGGEDEE